MNHERTGISPHSKSLIQRLIARDGLRCHWCRRTCDPTQKPGANLFPTVEHVIRRADGGHSNMRNCVVACRKCNNERHVEGWTPKPMPIQQDISVEPQPENFFASTVYPYRARRLPKK